MKLNNKGYAITVIVFGILIVFIIVLSSLLVTMNNSVKLNKTVKQDVIENIQLGADTTGMSLTERIEQLENNYATVEQNVINKIYPVGSVYISTTDDSIDDVVARFGGEWEKYSQGRTLVGDGSTTDSSGNALVYNANSEGGSTTTVLSTSNLPSHNHSYTPSGKITSTFSGDKVTTSSDGKHEHFVTNYGSSKLYSQETQSEVGHAGMTYTWNYTTTYPLKTTNDGAHTHTVTPTGTVTSTFKGTQSNTGLAGSGTSFSVQNPYITVYMYKRIK